MTNTLIKFAVLILAIKEIWLLLGVPAVVNAVTSFLMMGQIPGTNHAMSPGEVIRLVIVLFVILALLIFRREIFRLVRFAFHRRSMAISTPALTPIPHPLASPQAVAPVEEQIPTLPERAHELEPTIVHRWAWRLRAVMFLAWIRLNVLAISVWTRGDQYGRIVLAYAQVWGIRLAQWAKIAAVFVGRKAIEAWRWTEPHLRRFDAYLERKLHAYDTTSTLLSLGSEMTSTVQKWRNNANPKEQRK